MDYYEAEDLQEQAEREAGGQEEHLEPPPEEEDAAREELRQLVGTRADPQADDVPPMERPDLSGRSTADGLQNIAGKCPIPVSYINV